MALTAAAINNAKPGENTKRADRKNSGAIPLLRAVRLGRVWGESCFAVAAKPLELPGEEAMAANQAALVIEPVPDDFTSRSRSSG